MSSEGYTPVPDCDENTSGLQNYALENDLGTQIDDSNDVGHEDIDYDPYSMLEEASPVPATNTLEQSDNQARHNGEDREPSIRKLVEDVSVRHASPLQDRTESPQTSQGPTPTQRSRDSRSIVNGSKSPVIKMEEQEDDICSIKSNTLEEVIIISDDEDMDEPKPNNRNMHQSSDRTTNHPVSHTEGINMGNSILRTPTQRKISKAQMQSLKRAQQEMAKQFSRKLVTGGAGTVFKGIVGQDQVGSGMMNTVREAAIAATDENAWMNEEMDSDDSVSSVT